MQKIKLKKQVYDKAVYGLEQLFQRLNHIACNIENDDVSARYIGYVEIVGDMLTEVDRIGLEDEE